MREVLQMKNEKMGLMSCILMGIGSIIGASVFASTPIAIKIVGGHGIVIGFILAAVFVFVRSIPEMLLGSSLPATGGSYMYLSRLVHPIAGALDAFNELVVGVMKIATMALTFSTYFKYIMPSCPEQVSACLAIIVFTIISCFGLRISSIVQNICVAVLVVALGCFIFMGWGNTAISFGAVISDTVQLSALWAAMGILHGSLIGANVLVYSAEEIDNPGKSIPIAYLVSTLFTAIVYALIGYVTVGVAEQDGFQAIFAITDLAEVADKFMGRGMFLFFVAGGALLAVVTSINSAMMMFARINFAAARDGLFPKAISNLNKHGAPVISLWFNSILAIIGIISGYDLEDVVKITSIPGLFLTPVTFLAVYTIKYKYPNAYANRTIKTPHWLNCLLTTAAIVLCLVLGWYVFGTMEPRHYMLMVGYYAVALVYTIARYFYLKNQGVALFKNMGETYQPWEEMEKNAIKALGDKAIKK